MMDLQAQNAKIGLIYKTEMRFNADLVVGQNRLHGTFSMSALHDVKGLIGLEHNAQMFVFKYIPENHHYTFKLTELREN